MIRLAILTGVTSVTNGQTDRQIDEQKELS